MTRTLRCLALFVGFAFLMNAAATQSLGQDKKEKEKKKKKAPVGLVVEATEKAGKWGASRVALGIRVYTDRNYLLAAFPKEMLGGTLITRSGDDQRKWLPDAALKANTDVTAYAMVLVKYLGKDKFDETHQKLLVKEGWKEVDGKVGTTFPSGEGWEWKAFKKDVDEGEIILQLKDLSWEKHGTGVLFIFKKRAKPKP